MARLRRWREAAVPLPFDAVELASAVDRHQSIERYTRARPGQSWDASNYAFGVGGSVDTLAYYAYNNWVMTAVSRLASRAAAAALMVVMRDDPIKSDDAHGLAQLLGKYGRPNDYQDSLEFLEMHFTHCELAGNSFWYWDRENFMPGPPEQVHILDPRQIRIVPGRRLAVDHYEYWVGGTKFSLPPWRVTHFKRANPYSIYWGLSVLEALRIEIRSDNGMAHWNADWFGEGVSIPTGIMVVPTGTNDAELERMDDELHGKHGGRRRTAIVKAPVGGTAYLPAGAVHKDLDFANGRLLSRRAVYEALELPLGLMSEASTEAHARVAERQLVEAVAMRHTRTVRKLNMDALGFWPGHNKREARFEDLSLRAADWDRESKRLTAIRPYMTTNEVRTQILHLPEMAGGDELGGAQNGVSQGADGAQDRRDSSAVSGDGQTQDVVRSPD